MATNVSAHIACQRDLASAAEVAIERAFEWLREVDRRLTRFDAESELCRMNASAGQWMRVSSLLLDAVEQGVRAATASGGLFDPTVLPLLLDLGYDRDFTLIRDTKPSEPSASPRAMAPWQPGAWREIELDRAASRIRLPAGAQLDLGGIAKGWAADIAVQRFFVDFPNVLFELSGDMRLRGYGTDGYPWAIGVENPRVSETTPESALAVVALARGGVATSGATRTWWRRYGARQHHLLDPRAGSPVRLWISAEDDGPGAETLIATATAFAPSAAHAEVAAKLALLRGYPAALRAVEETWNVAGGDAAPYTDAGVALLLVMGDGRVVCSENLRDWLATCGGGGELWLD